MNQTIRNLLLLCPRGRGCAYDAFASSIVHAYEPARRVLTSYTGNLVRLRRASDNAESDFRYGANGNLNTAAIAAWAGGASYVVTVYDQAPAGDNVTQAVAANQPLYVASIRNGHAGMTFDGTNDCLRGAFTTGGALSQPFSLFAVARLDAAGVNDDEYRMLTDSDDIANRLIMGQYPTGAPDTWRIMGGATLVGSGSDALWNIWSALFNGASSQFWHNGVSEASGNAGAQNADGLTVGDSFNDLGRWWGDIVSVIICDPSLSDAQRVAMQVQMNSYWAVY